MDKNSLTAILVPITSKELPDLDKLFCIWSLFDILHCKNGIGQMHDIDLIITLDVKENHKISESIEEAYNLSVDNTWYDEFLNLNLEDKELLVKVLILSIKELFTDLINSKLPIHLPYIGTLKIKDGNKIALKNMIIVAKEFDCKLYSDIPKDKIEEAKVLLFNLNIKDKRKLKEQREVIRLQAKEGLKIASKNKKVININKHIPKILTFNINNIK